MVVQTEGVVTALRMQKLAHLSDEELLGNLQQCCADVRELTARILGFLVEVEERRLHLAMASPSMFDFCKRRLKMSEGRAYRHVAGARLVRRFPFLLEQIERGEVFLSTLTTLAPYLSEANVHELVADTRGKKRWEIDAILAARFGKPFSYHFGPTLVMDDELAALVAWARDHFSNAIPDGDLTKVTKRVFSELKDRVEKEARQAAAAPPLAKAKPTKSVPRQTRRHVHARDNGRCTYVDPKTGERCPARAFIQLDHVIGRADDGGDGIDNLRLACRAHNLWFAERRYGKEYIQKRIRQRRSPSSAKAAAT